MWNACACILVAMLVGACSISADVVGKVGRDGKTFRGTATGYMDRTGTIDMADADGNKCVGEFRYTGAKTGFGRLQCNDGRTANIQFNALSNTSGYGYGFASDGGPILFTYGLSESESAIYLNTPETAAREAESDRSTGSSVSGGTGFLISTRGHILTNHHVVDGCESLTARFADGSSGRGRVVASDELNDLAVVRTSSPVISVAVFNAVPTYRQGDQVVVYGFPLVGALSEAGNLTTGTLSALSGLGNDSRYIQISAPVQPGNSGGPLVDDKGNVIGVVTSKLNAIRVAEATGDIPQNVNFAIKDVVAKSFLQAHDIPFAEGGSDGPSLTAADIGDVLREKVVFLQCKGG